MIKLNWGAINQVTTQVFKKILDKYPEIFKDELGTLQDTRAKIHVDSQTTPRFFKPRSVPHTLRDRVEKELDRLLSEGLTEPVQFSNWAAPIVPIVKEDGCIRICGDYRVTINHSSKLDS